MSKSDLHLYHPHFKGRVLDSEVRLFISICLEERGLEAEGLVSGYKAVWTGGSWVDRAGCLVVSLLGNTEMILTWGQRGKTVPTLH